MKERRERKKEEKAFCQLNLSAYESAAKKRV